MKSTRGIAGILLVLILATLTSRSDAAVSSSPSINLDGALPSSLATSSPTRWNDLSTGTLQLTIGSNSAYSSFGGGSLTQTSSGSSGAYLAPGVATGTPSNPSGDISIFAWVYLTSWNLDWNIIASRWFNGFAGGGGVGFSDYHFAIKTSGSAHKLNLYTTGNSDIYGSRDLALNKWYHVGFTLSGTNLAFYVNGKYDTPTVTTNVLRTAYTSNYLFVGDLRSSCTGCAFNGYLAKFRMWPSALSQSAISSDYQGEAIGLGYSSTPTLSLSNTSPKYRISNTITATVNTTGKVSFYEKGKKIPRCQNISISSTTGSCSWKPVRHGVTNISATFVPTDSDYIPSTVSRDYIVSARSTTR